MYYISMVTMNRLDILRRVLAQIERCTPEPFTLLITDNGSTDGTPDFLRHYAGERPGQTELWLLPENVGVCKARNAHWDWCIGQDAVKLDDKVEITTPHWLPIVFEQCRRLHAIMGFTDPETEQLWSRAAEVEAAAFPQWKCGASMFIPSELSKELGAFCEDYGLYGHEDLDYMDRAECLGWHPWLYTLKAYGKHLARAGTWGRAYVQPFIPIYEANREAYRQGERDLVIPIESTEGWRIGQEHKANPSSLVRRGEALLEAAR